MFGSTGLSRFQNDKSDPTSRGVDDVLLVGLPSDRVFLTYSTTGRGNEPADTSLGLLDMTPYGRREVWEDTPEGWPAAPDAGSPAGGHGAPICWYWRTDANGTANWGPTSRPTPQWPRPDAKAEQTLGRQSEHH